MIEVEPLPEEAPYREEVLVMKHTVTKTTYHVNLVDAEPCEGVTSGLRKVTVVPHTAKINVYSGGSTKVDLTGPKVKSDGTETAAHFTATVDTWGGMYVKPNQQILDLIAEVTGAAEQEPESVGPKEGSMCWMVRDEGKEGWVEHRDPCRQAGQTTNARGEVVR